METKRIEVLYFDSQAAAYVCNEVVFASRIFISDITEYRNFNPSNQNGGCTSFVFIFPDIRSRLTGCIGFSAFWMLITWINL